MAGRFGSWLGRWRRPRLEVGAADDAADDQQRVLGLNPSRIPTGRQWQLLSAFLSPSERVWVRFLTVVAVLSGLTLLVIGGLRRLAVVPKVGGNVSIGFVGSPQFINPVLARENTVDADLTKLLFRGVVRIDENFQPVPDLAESIKVSDDKKTYTIVFHRNRLWSDGEKITADDLKFTIDTIKDAEYGSPIRSHFQTANVEVPDEFTAVITLDRALSAFPSYLDIGLLPHHAWLDATPQIMALAELNVKPISNGPYKFQSVTKDRNGNIKALTLARDRNYLGTAPYINRITAKFYPERSTAIDALRTDAIDSLGGITVEENKSVAKKLSRSSFAISQLIAVFFNQRDNPTLKVKEVRQALAMSTDRHGIVSSIFPDVASELIGPVLPGYPGYQADLKVPAYDVAAANALLESAGWKRNEKGVRQKGAQQLQFALTVPNEPSYVSAAERLITDWQSIGASIEIKTIDASRIQRDVIRPREYEIILFGQIQGADGDLYPYWHSSQQRDPGFNLALFFDAKVDQNLADARGAADLDKRIANYQEFQQLITDDIPAVFLLQQRFLVAHRPELRGLEAQRLASPSDRFRHIETWYVRTRLAWR